jgi:peptidoglycan-associated lipoprotein
MKQINTLLIMLFFVLFLGGCTDKKAPEPKDPSLATHDTVSIDEQINTMDETGASAYNSSTGGMRSIYFDFDSYTLSAGMQRAVASNAEVLRSSLAGRQVKLEGHCDEFGTDEYNYALGLRRASAVKEALMIEGVEASRITMVSYGESAPLCREATQQCYTRNRRVDLHPEE